MKPLIGNRRDAAMLVEACNEGRSHELTRIGSGGYRTAYLINGVVYKYGRMTGDGYDSRMEVYQAQTLYRRYKGNDGVVGAYVRIPRTSGFTMKGFQNVWNDARNDYDRKIVSVMVVAMEHIIGTHPQNAPYIPEAREELYSLGFRDMHGGNFLWENSTSYLVPIDLASPRSKTKQNRDWDNGPDLRVFARNGAYDDIMAQKQRERDAAKEAKAARMKREVCPCGCGLFV